MTEGTTNPRVSVIMPLYNHEQYVGEALRSVLNQTSADLEVIVIDDGSTDRSEEVVRSIGDGRLRFFRQENQGAGRTLNRGVELSRGAVVAVLNSDDVYFPERMEEALRILDGDLSVSAVFSHLEFIDDEGSHLRSPAGAEEYWADRDPRNSFRGTDQVLLDLLAGNFLITTSNLICRREVFDALAGFSDLRYAHDYEFFLRLCHLHKVRVIERPLLRYRVHGRNTVKENEAAVSFEVGLVLSSFFLNHDLTSVLSQTSGPGGDPRDLAVRLFNSVNTYHTDRLVMTLLLYGRYFGDRTAGLLEDFGGTPSSPLRNDCLEALNRQYEEWRRAQEGWERWDETNKRLIAREQELAEAWRQRQEGWERWDETNKRLIAADQRLADARAAQERAERALQDTEAHVRDMESHVQSVLKSRSYRAGRALTWPLRKLRDVMRAGGDGSD